MERSSVIERHRKCNTLERNHVAAKDIRLLKWYEGAWSLGGKNRSTRRPGLPEGWNTRTHLRWPDRVNGRSTRSLAAVDASPARGASQDYHAGAIWRVTRSKKGWKECHVTVWVVIVIHWLPKTRGEDLSRRQGPRECQRLFQKANIRQQRPACDDLTKLETAFLPHGVKFGMGWWISDYDNDSGGYCHHWSVWTIPSMPADLAHLDRGQVSR